MCVCDLSFKCVCAIWEGYILKPPARGWSSPYRRPCHYQACRPVSLCQLVQSTCRLVACSRLVALCGHRVTGSSGHLVTARSPGHLFTSSRLAAASIRAHLLINPVSTIHLEKIYSCGESLLVFILVSILTFPALILQTRCTFCRDYSLSSY